MPGALWLNALVPSDNTEQRRLAAIMFTDMVGYSTLAQRNDRLAQELLEEHRALLRPLFARFNGIEIKTIGDAFLVEFGSALEAAQCAIEIQRTLAKRNHDVSVERRVELKIGIHIGDVVHRGGDVYGDGVNIASRIEPLAGAGGICVSMDVERQIRNALEASFEKLAPTELKNITVPMDLFRIVLPWDTSARRAAGPQTVRKTASAVRWFIVGVAALVAFNTLLFWKFIVSPGPSGPAAKILPSAPEGIKSIAVLPFVSMSADKADEYLSDGMTEELLNVLAQVPGLRVPGRSSCFAFKGKTEDNIFRKVGEQLHVTTALEGSVRKAGDKLRITAQLINVADGFHLWSQTYDREMKDILAVQTEVAQQVVQALQVKLGVEAARALAKMPTENPEAHRLYLLGRHYALKVTDEDNKTAIEYFNAALKLDPNYARAYAGLADTWDIRLPPKEMFPLVRARAETALKLDPELAEAHCSKGLILLGEDWDFAGAEREFAQAIKLNPNLALAHDSYGWLLMFQRRFQEAEAALKKAVDLEPLAAYTSTDLATVYECAHEFEKSVEIAKQAVDLDPRHPWAHHILGWSLLHQGKPHEAIPHFEQERKLEENPFSRMSLGCAYAAIGDRAKAEAVIKELDELAIRRYVSASAQAYIWRYLNKKDRALTQLERSVVERDPGCVWFKVDPAFDILRPEPRFQALLKKIGFPQ
jgi:TolB-like protein/class 3 adenylate cyclase